MPNNKTMDNLVNFTTAFETFSNTPYLDTNGKRILAGYGSTNPTIIGLAKRGLLSKQIALQEVKTRLTKDYNRWKELYPNLSDSTLLALTDASYNISNPDNLLNKSPNLKKLLDSGEDNPNKLIIEMNWNKDNNGWLGVRSAARRAMAVDKFDWDWKHKDIHGRDIDHNQYKGPEDWKSSPYWKWENPAKAPYQKEVIEWKEDTPINPMKTNYNFPKVKTNFNFPKLEATNIQNQEIPYYKSNGNILENLDDEAYGLIYYKKGGKIYIKPENKGKFIETKKRTGKTTEELTHSKNLITRKRAIFAQNAKKWKH